ncbi:MAG: hypothetical protein POG74_04975 [Acidocella sp.]|nr:hypothetical protein [Acidocella sp.]
MAYKVNYGLERAERNRAKLAKKEAKLRDKKAGVKSDEPEAEPTDEASTATPEPPAEDA